MIVHHVSTYPHGGAATAALQLHRSLLDEQVTSRFYYSHDDRASQSAEHGLVRLQPHLPSPNSWRNPLLRHREKTRFRRITHHFNQHLRDRDSRLESFSSAEQLEGVRLKGMAQNAEILHLHWIAYLADYPSFFESIPRHTPIVWTLHDMNPFTGGCHFSGGCQRFKRACGNCNQVCNPSESDISAHSLSVKRAALEGRTIHVVSPSQWMLEQARRSAVWPTQTSFSRIPYGVDLLQYGPTDRSAAKISLGIAPDATVIGFGADNLQNPRKGFELLRAALERARHRERLTAVVFGHGVSAGQALSLSNVISPGYVANVSEKVAMINACDMFVVPSLEDNQPQMAIEAMACGVPVIGFDSGGIGEMFHDGYEGRLVRCGDVAALADAVDWMAANPESASLMGKRSRVRANQDYNAPVQAKAYLELYRQIAARLPLVNRTAA